MSHLLQMRGLKPVFDYKIFSFPWSHLLQMRGLKQIEKLNQAVEVWVASFTDAWIETCARIYSC